ncbi:hypothetical protein [Haloprofundus halophilus]|uniref:hypothetical protein n=1 Tax=Haloprofundus halophilus TaxID=2283527 RepID=UPI000E42FA42|nr:hypothetical protein [Haloprofundus halophilus]
MSERVNFGNWSRRQLVGGFGAAAVGGSAVGLLAFREDQRERPVETMEPNGDGTSSAGELRWLLADAGIDVREMVRRGDDLVVRYTSGASSIDEHNQELVEVTSQFVSHVDNGGGGARLVAEVDERFDDVETQYHATAKWVDAYLNEEMSSMELVNTVARTERER